MKSTQKNEMYMANARNLRHLTQEIPTCWYFFALGNTKALSFALGDTKLPNANGFASQWNIGFKFPKQIGLKMSKGVKWIFKN